MTCFDPSASAAEDILDSLRELLAEISLVELIDEPIDKAVRSFQCPGGRVESQRDFLDRVASFLQHVYASAFPTARQLTSAQARDEAVSLLEQGGFPAGYRAALWEAGHPLGPGIRGILAELSVFLKLRLREAHVRWVFTEHLGCLDWPTKCQLASLILQRWGDRTPPELSAQSAEQYANFLPLLVQRDLYYRPPRQPPQRAQGARRS